MSEQVEPMDAPKPIKPLEFILLPRLRCVSERQEAYANSCREDRLSMELRMVNKTIDNIQSQTHASLRSSGIAREAAKIYKRRMAERFAEILNSTRDPQPWISGNPLSAAYESSLSGNCIEEARQIIRQRQEEEWTDKPRILKGENSMYTVVTPEMIEQGTAPQLTEGDYPALLPGETLTVCTMEEERLSVEEFRSKYPVLCVDEDGQPLPDSRITPVIPRMVYITAIDAPERLVHGQAMVACR